MKLLCSSSMALMVTVSLLPLFKPPPDPPPYKFLLVEFFSPLAPPEPPDPPDIVYPLVSLRFLITAAKPSLHDFTQTLYASPTLLVLCFSETCAAHGGALRGRSSLVGVSNISLWFHFGFWDSGSRSLWGTPHLSSAPVNVYHHYSSSPLRYNFSACLTVNLTTTEVVSSLARISTLPRPPLHPFLLTDPVTFQQTSSANLTVDPEDRNSPLTLLSTRRCSDVLFACRRERTRIARTMGFHRFVVFVALGLTSPSGFQKYNLNLSPYVSQPNLWGSLVFLTGLLKIFDGFIEVFTETDVFSMLYLFLLKNHRETYLPVDSPVSSLSSSPSSSPPPAYAFSMRSVSPSAQQRGSLPTSITDLLSCVAVRSGPEDTTDFVLTIIRGADWVPTSQPNVTIVQLSGFAVTFILTHSSFATNSLSFYFRGFSTSILYVFGFYACNAMISNSCNPNV